MDRARPSRSILVVDDEQDTVRTFEAGLKSGGYSVVSFTSAKEALSYLALHPSEFDLVISDIRMPFLDGIEFAKSVRKYLPELRIVLVTAFEYEREHVEPLGISEIARKPISMPQLLAIAARHSTRSEKILDKIYRCRRCGSLFLFVSDVEDHKQMKDHLDFEEVKF